jgi:hypothetical protein
MAVKPRKSRIPVAPQARKSDCYISVRIAVTANAKLAALSALAGMDKSAYVAKLISDNVAGLILIDKRKSGDHGGVHDEADGGIDGAEAA